MKGSGTIVAAAFAAMVAAGPVSAACWSRDAVEAAHVRDLDMMMMVATLRCRLHGVEMSADYNRFAREKRALLAQADEALRAQFAVDRGGRAALDAYDRFVTAAAERHGAGSPEAACADRKLLVEAAVAAAPSRAALVDLAVRAGARPALPVEACTRQIALAH